MNRRIDDLIQRIRELEKELSLEFESELETIRHRFNYTIERGRIRFQQGAIAAQKGLKVGMIRYLWESNILFVLSSPLIYSLIVPLLLLDLVLSVYQSVCFPLYGLKKVVRRDYLIFDRHHLAYLNGIEKMNCIYCGYGNGLLSYGLEIASRTEAYWCPIKHARPPRDSHSRYHLFAEYGDARAYRERLHQLRTKKEQP